MRPDLVVPGENEENFVVARDARVVTVPFSPIEKRFAKEKPQLMPGLQKLREELEKKAEAKGVKGKVSIY